MYLFKVMKSKYCKSIFLISLIGSYFLIPDTVFNGFYYIIAITFMVTFSLSIMCIVRSIKDRATLAKKSKASLLSIIATALGLSALQVCGVSIPVCGASIGIGLLSVVFPQFFVDFLANYSPFIIGFSIILQLVALYYMGCFIETQKKKIKALLKTKKEVKVY
jgi:hypothetical protein